MEHRPSVAATVFAFVPINLIPLHYRRIGNRNNMSNRPIMGHINLMGDTISLPIIDCTSYRIKEVTPQCDLGLDLAGCGSCERRVTRNGDLRRPPLFIVTDVDQPAPAQITPEQPKQGFRGLGDVVAAATKAIGIKPCQACGRRQAALNRLVPFGVPNENPPPAGQLPAAADGGEKND
jgi:hypothetical protein